MSAKGGGGVSAVVLAAGRSRRYVGTKQIAELAGTPLVARAVATASSAGIGEIVVVLGHQADAVVAVVPKEKSVKIVVNAGFESGLGSSIRTGLQSMRRDAKGVMLILADQPLVTTDLLERMLDLFQRKGSDETIVAASFGDLIAPPVIFSKRYFQELTELKGDRGAKSVIRRHEAAVLRVRVNSKRELTDIDTRGDLGAARETFLQGRESRK